MRLARTGGHGTAPLKVTIVNDSADPVSVRYDQIYLTGADGKRYGSLPPYEAQKEAAQSVTPPPGPGYLVYNRFFVAPHMRFYYPYLTPLGDRFLYDPIYYDQHCSTRATDGRWPR